MPACTRSQYRAGCRRKERAGKKGKTGGTQTQEGQGRKGENTNQIETAQSCLHTALLDLSKFCCCCCCCCWYAVARCLLAACPGTP